MASNDQIREVQARMAKLAADLARRYTPMNAVCILAGAAMGLLLENFDKETAAHYFKELAAEILGRSDQDDDEQTPERTNEKPN
jgi:hypothetical protein